VKIGGLVQLTRRVKAATKERTGINPATKEPITIAAKPEMADVQVKALARAKSALPPVETVRQKLAA
jgi:nucleoid DNA-binding protein